MIARWEHRTAFAIASLGALACNRTATVAPPPPPAIVAEAGFVDVAPRAVTVHGAPVDIGARARLFYNLEPSTADPERAPIFVLFNGFAAEIVRGFGTGPMTVADGGDVSANPSSLTSTANLLYVDPRQAGFSYDVVDGRSPLPSDCAPGVFNEYVDAADVLLGVLAFLDAHPRLHGPVYWVGESYGGVRVQWILAFLRNVWSIAPYDDPLLRARLEKIRSAKGIDRLLKGQILLEPWLFGKAHADAIAADCSDADTVHALEASLGGPCAVADACACASANGRSFYNFAFSVDRQARRVFEADLAHVTTSRIDALLGVPIDRIAGLGATDRRTGFKCDKPDSTLPPEDDIAHVLGPLPNGQFYFVPYSPLEPGKEVEPFNPDWRSETFEASAFLDNLRDVPAFVTDGPLDLVVPTKALVPALRAVIDPARVDDADPTHLRVSYPDGDRFIDVRRYPNAGHMVTMLEAPRFSNDVTAWIRER